MNPDDPTRGSGNSMNELADFPPPRPIINNRSQVNHPSLPSSSSDNSSSVSNVEQPPDFARLAEALEKTLRLHSPRAQPSLRREEPSAPPPLAPIRNEPRKPTFHPVPSRKPPVKIPIAKNNSDCFYGGDTASGSTFPPVPFRKPPIAISAMKNNSDCVYGDDTASGHKEIYNIPPPLSSGQNSNRSSSNMAQPSDQWHVDPNVIEKIEKLGAGFYGEVWKAKWMNLNTVVAMKTLNPSTEDMINYDFTKL